MLSDDEKDLPTKCRERRRRRIEMRRLATVSTASSSHAGSRSERDSRLEDQSGSEIKRIRLENSSSSSSGNDVEDDTTVKETVDVVPMVEPVFGTMSISGRSREMEDAISVRTGLCQPAISRRQPAISRRQPVHFFAVYDGHGGAHVAELCKERMESVVEEELAKAGSTRSKSASGGEEEEEEWKKVLKKSFERMDEVALSTCACGSVGGHCGCHPMEVALGGSTAVVAILTPEHIVVANCGDSRAVLCRGKRAVALSNDHKPDRPDELARIEAAGGRVIFVNGARVEGILAMSRAIGDKYLKSVVISEPEITFTKRESEDECLILASDGLWDVISSDLACEVASECLQEGAPSTSTIDLNETPQPRNEETEAFYPSRSALAAALLTRLALGRKSCDNISVIVIDLKKS